MQLFLVTIISLVAYVGGLIIIVKTSPMLLSSPYYEGMFMGVAAADIIGGILAYGAMAVTFYLFNGAFGIRVLDFILLVGLLIVGLRMTRRGMRSHTSQYRSSRIAVSFYGALLAIVALFSMIALFTVSTQP